METKQSMDCILKDPSAQAKPVVPRLITVNPLNIIIEPSSGQIDKTLELKNIYPCRIAFRIQTNGPTRYTVCPNKGFLSIGEKSMIQISMIDGSKYQSNHQFIVQAKPAPGDFADRKLIWKQPNVLGILTNTRVKTMRPGQYLTKSQSKSPSAHLAPVDSSGANSPAPAIMEIVNQIKSIEVELDRQAQLVNELSERVKKGEMQYSNLVIHERNLRAEMERYKPNDSEQSGS
ncbi:unnamed protein product [Caenorhabditis brenneri]